MRVGSPPKQVIAHRDRVQTRAILRYKRLWKFIGSRDGVTFDEVRDFLGETEQNARTILMGASVYPGSRIYEEANGRRNIFKWLED